MNDYKQRKLVKRVIGFPEIESSSSSQREHSETYAVVWVARTGDRFHSSASMPSMRQSYTVTVPEEPPAAAFPFLKQEMRRKGSMSGSVLVSTFVGLIINQAKVRDCESACCELWAPPGVHHTKLHSKIWQFNRYIYNAPFVELQRFQLRLYICQWFI